MKLQEDILQDKIDNKSRKRTGKFLTIQDIAMIGMMVAIIEVCKTALSFLPNIELTTFWVIMFTVFFGWKIIFVIPVFILIETVMYPFGLWIIMYLYAWPLLALIAWLCRKKDSVWFFSILSAAFGLSFGLLCAIPYIFIYASGGGLKSGLSATFAWWIAGIPWDIVHGVGNFVIMMVLYYPVRRVMERVKKIYR